MHNESIRYLIVPGWQGSPDDHWQTHWQNSLPNSTRVEQADWLKPRREDWVGELQRTIAEHDTPVILIAHSLGCVTVAHWAQLAPLETLRQVQGALLVAPADVERPNCPPALRNFAPVPTDLLPFPTQIVCGQLPAGHGDGAALGRRTGVSQSGRAYQRQIRSSTLGAGLRLPVPAAKPSGAARTSSRMTGLLFTRPVGSCLFNA